MRDPITRIETELREIRQRLSKLPVRWALAAVSSIVKLVETNGSLAAGDKVQADVLRWNPDTEDWDDTGVDIQIRDYRTSGSAIGSGKRCVVLRLFSIWIVVSTQC